MNSGVDAYLADGCGRCPLYKTPDCKVNSWRLVLLELRNIVLDCGLQEELKWSQPVYCIDGKNVLLLSCFKDTAFLSFFSGSLLNDPDGLLVPAGPNSTGGRLLKFTTVEEVLSQEVSIRRFVKECSDLVRSGAKVERKELGAKDFPEELIDVLESDPEFAGAFFALTPGRQRGYVIHFSGAKQSATRAGRIEKCREKIIAGLGFFD